jgi:hypothetical protein
VWCRPGALTRDEGAVAGGNRDCLASASPPRARVRDRFVRVNEGEDLPNVVEISVTYMDGVVISPREGRRCRTFGSGAFHHRRIPLGLENGRGRTHDHSVHDRRHGKTPKPCVEWTLRPVHLKDRIGRWEPFVEFALLR